MLREWIVVVLSHRGEAIDNQIIMAYSRTDAFNVIDKQYHSNKDCCGYIIEAK